MIYIYTACFTTVAQEQCCHNLGLWYLKTYAWAMHIEAVNVKVGSSKTMDGKTGHFTINVYRLYNHLFIWAIKQ